MTAPTGVHLPPPLPPAGPLRPALTPRAWSPSVGLAAVLALLVVVVAARRGDLSPVTLMEVSLCLAAGLSGPFPRVGGPVTTALLAVFLLVPQELGLGAYAAVIPVLAAGVAGLRWLRGGLVAASFGLLVAISARTLRPDEVLADYALFWLGWVAAAWVFGNAVRELLVASERRWHDLLAEQRREIARDLHDTIAHGLSLIVMRGEQARLAGGASLEDMEFIVARADRAIQDLRGMLTLLRTDDAPDAVPRGVRSLRPLRDELLDSLAELRRHGFTPSLSVEGDLGRLPDSVSEALAKVVHEASSNIVRHGMAGTDSGVLVDVGDRDVELVVSSVPRPARQEMRDHPPLGLAGMRERVQALGGDFSAGRGAERWIVRARIPFR